LVFAYFNDPDSTVLEWQCRVMAAEPIKIGFSSRDTGGGASGRQFALTADIWRRAVGGDRLLQTCRPALPRPDCRERDAGEAVAAVAERSHADIIRMTPPRDPIYAGHRYPAEIISYAVWLYFRFPLSLRVVEEMLAARRISVTHETIRQWGLKFGREFAHRIRRRAPRRGDKWHLDDERACSRAHFGLK
jgi:hypothetical protein